MKMLLRYIACVLGLVGSLKASSVTAPSETVNGLTWYYSIRYKDSGREAEITGTLTAASSLYGDVIVPSKLGGYPVTRIASTVFKNGRMSSVTIPSSVTSIEANTFSGCSYLKSISLSAGLTHIGEKAFFDCSWLTRVAIPSSVIYIGKDAFLGCSGLTRVDITDLSKWCEIEFACRDGWPSNPLNSAKHLYINGTEVVDMVIPSGVRDIGKYAFWNCEGLKSVTIPSSVISIGEESFYGCSGLESVMMSDGVKVIENGAFMECHNLTSVTIPPSVETIGISSFFNCKALARVNVGNLGKWCGISFADAGANPLTYAKHLYLNGSEIVDLVIPEGVENVNTYAFRGCIGLASVSIPQGVKNIDAYAFSGCSAMASVVLPEGVTNIGEQAFQGCVKLKTVTMPSSMANIAHEAFCGCSGLTSVTIPSSVTSIGWGAFQGCIGLLSVTIPSGVTSIEYDAFRDCRGLTSVTILDGVTSIGNSAFRDCYGLMSVTIPSSVTSIGAYAFEYCSGLKSVTVPSSVASIGSYAFSGCSGLTRVDITDLAKWCGISFGSLYANPLYYAKHLYLNGEEVKDLAVPEGVTSIGAYAFCGCSGLVSVTIPSRVTSIGSSAFSGCSGLKAVTMPTCVTKLSATFPSAYEKIKEVVVCDGVTSIGYEAFRGCSGLTSVVMPASVTSIGSYAFHGCSELTSVTMPGDVTNIGDHAFYGCSGLMSMTIPSRVTSVGDFAFSHCTSLTSVTIPESVTSIGWYAFDQCSGSTSVICAYGDVGRIKSLMSGAYMKVSELIFKERPPMPVFTPSTGTIFNEPLKISITCAVENATIHYTMDGTEPTVDSPVFKKFMLSEKAEIKAIAEYDGCVSEVATAVYAKGWCVPPVISSSNQEFHFSGKDVIITCASEGAEIRYTTDGSVPTAQSRLYEGPFTIDDTTTVRAIAVGHPDYFDSEIAAETFTREWLTVANPTCDPPNGTTFYLSGQEVVLSCEEGASIFYTLNGDLPTRECARYEEPLSINDTTTIRMVAVRDDYRDSEVVAVKLTRDYYKVAAPTLSVNGSVSFTGSKFIITVSREMTPGAVLRYTLDGSDPTEESPILGGDSIVVTATTTVKVRAFIEDWKPSDIRAVEVTKVRTLGDALNLPDVAFETSAAYPWVADRNVTHDDVESARSGATPHNGCSWLQTTVDQATYVKFWWKVSCEKDWDGLSFLTNGIPVAKIDGNVDWTNLALHVPAGTVLRWEYNKDETTSDGSDCGWVDEITLTTGMPAIEGDEGATVTGDAESGFVIKPSEGNSAVEVTMPQGVDASKVSVEVSTKVATVKPNGAKVKVVVGDNDITGFLLIPESEGVLNIAAATVREEIVKETLDPSKDAVIELNAANPRLTTAPTRMGLTYTLYEGHELKSLSKGDSKLGDGDSWTPTITVSGGNAAFYSIDVTK